MWYHIHMKRTTLFIDEQVERELQVVARRERRPVAAVVREAIATYVARAQDATRPTEPGFVAVGRSGHRTTAARHEELLWKDLDPHGRAPNAPVPGSSPQPRRGGRAGGPARPGRS